MTSVLTSGQDALVAAGIAVLTGAGYAFSPLTTSLNQYLATALIGLGGSGTYLTKSRAELLAALVTLSGTTVTALNKTEMELWALLADASFGGGGGVALKADFANTATTEAWVFW